MLIQLHKILDIAQCYEILRMTRWQDGVTCPTCGSKEIVKMEKTLFKKNVSTINVSLARLFLMT